LTTSSSFSSPASNLGRLAGKVALVTGAGSVGAGWGNGRAIAVRFAQEGARVYGVDREQERLDETARLVNEAGGSFVSDICDVSSSTSIADMVARCLSEYGCIDVLVNTVVPGQLHTPMVEARLAGQRAGGDVQALLRQRQSRIPLPFMGDGRDTANAALYLACEESRFVTGTEIVVDGGMSARCD
jgi:NAD(P)-dependent dehydrogenase (short-subunit alcohol dehydrogenase family)